MYARRLKYNGQKWGSIFQQSWNLLRLNSRGFRQSRSHGGNNTSGSQQWHGDLMNKFRWSSNLLTSKHYYAGLCGRQSAIRFYSSQGGDGRSASEDKVPPVKDATNFDKFKTRREKVLADVRRCDEHARLGELDQKEWLNNEKLSFESKKKESPFLTKKERFKNEFTRRVVPWEKMTVSWETFPYHIDEHVKSLLVECAASHLKHNKFAASYGARLTSSSARILLHSSPGTELYRERLVRALARDLQVPLLVLDSNVLAPRDFGHEFASECETDDDSVESEECSSESEGEDENDESNGEEWGSSSEVKSESSDDDAIDVQSAEVLKKIIPYDFEKSVSGEPHGTQTSVKPDNIDSSQESKRSFKKGDRVKYIGTSARSEVDNRAVSSGQRGEVYEVNGDQVAVILENNDGKASIYWIDMQDIEHDLDSQAEDWYIAMEALCEVLPSLQPAIVYFPDFTQWLLRAVPKSNRKTFVLKVEEVLDQISGPVVFICGQNKVENGSKEKEKLTMVLPHLGRLGRLPMPLKRLTEGLKANKTSKDYDICRLFNNVLSIHPPKEAELLRIFDKQIEEDRRIVISRSNICEIYKVLETHELSCMELLQVNTEGVILTKQKAEKVVGWARSHYLSSCVLPCIKGDRLMVPRESLEIAISRLKEQETISRRPTQNLKSLAKDEYESNFVSAVVPPDEIGVKFDDVGALEDVKRTLNELVTLPMRRPELFSHGNLLRPCRGVLLFGPPGTGKTLLAKALATEAGANFISITGSTLTSKWFGDTEKLTKALFSFATRLAPVIIFVDEVDSLLGARGGSHEHEATRRMRNEFMAAWDGLRSNDNQRILVLGATNRPFDLDDAVIRRLPRRIYIDLPDAVNRMKILRVLLAQENLVSDFRFEELANGTEGYSGSDLKNLCIAAAYRPVQELLEKERKDGTSCEPPILRPLDVDDFIQAKSKVAASVAYDATSMNELRRWNEQYGEGGSRRKSPYGFGTNMI